MQCPNCGNQVPARPVCQRCGASLFGNPGPALPPSAEGPVPVPLSSWQKAQLLAGCLPVVTLALMVAGYYALVSRAIVPGPPTPFFVLVGVVLLVTGYEAFNNLRDLFSGVALAQEDLLHRSYRSRGRQGGSHFYGRFERLGTLRMVAKAHYGSSAGSRYRVVYSPASKLVWALEPPDPRIWS